MAFVLPPPVWVWGIPLTPINLEQTLEWIDQRIQQQAQPTYIVTVNLHTAMLAHQQPRFRETVLQAGLAVADGMPLLWASRWRRSPLPARVTGSDLVPALLRLAAHKGYRVFLLGGAPGVAEQAAARIQDGASALHVVGMESPPFRPLSAEEEDALIARIRTAAPHLLVAALSQPRGEIWLQQKCQAMGVPVCIQSGAALDFLAGRVPRAPAWIQRMGLEWAYRLYQEPARMLGRYASNGAFFLRMFTRDAVRRLCRRPLQ
jgi:N-acetylglucosaminyldiphosphoundecaprenol N-acetyl-beta-D-mannosaminyltransferase